MEDCIIDTNVLLVASAHHAAQQPEHDRRGLFTDSDHVPVEQREIVFKWLKEFRENGERKMVLDISLKIWDEYHNQMTRGQDFGSLVAQEKLQFAARFVDIAFDKNGHGLVPDELKRVDPSDRKFVALALKDMTDGGSSVIVNACDRGWYNCEDALAQAGVVVLQIIEEWSRRQWTERQNQQNKPAGKRPMRARDKK